MTVLKIQLLISIMFVSFFAAADVVIPGEKKNTCSEMTIRDPKEVDKLISLITSAPKVEAVYDGKTKFDITTKEMNLGGDTTIRCTQISQGDVLVNYFRGQRPGCFIVQRVAKKGGQSNPATAQ